MLVPAEDKVLTVGRPSATGRVQSSRGGEERPDFSSGRGAGKEGQSVKSSGEEISNFLKERGARRGDQSGDQKTPRS